MADKQFKRVIDLQDGSGVQVFEDDTMEGLVEQLATAQENATRKIREQNKQIKDLTPRETQKPVVEMKRRELTADERFTVTQDLQDPTKAVEAVNRIVEAELGAPLNKVREELSQAELARRAEAERMEAEAFISDNADYIVCRQNSEAIGKVITERNLAVTKLNLQEVYDELKATGLLVLNEEKKDESTVTPERIVPDTRPRGSQSSSLRSSQSNVSVGTKSKSITRAELDMIPTSELERRLKQDPDFRRMVDAMTDSVS